MYDINTKKYNKGIIFLTIPIVICAIFIIYMVWDFIDANKIDKIKLAAMFESKNSPYIDGILTSALGILVVAAFMTVFIIIIINRKKKIKRLEELNKIGKLIKGIPYRLVNSNTYSGDDPLSQIEIKYILSSGKEVTLHGDPISNSKKVERFGKADLVIDENNPDNYYVDFEINRLLGNTSADYYVNPNGEENNITVQEEHNLDPKTEIRIASGVEMIKGIILLTFGLMLLSSCNISTLPEGHMLRIVIPIISGAFIVGGIFFIYKGRKVNKSVTNNQNENMEPMVIEEGKKELEVANEKFTNIIILIIAALVAISAIYFDYIAYKNWNEGGMAYLIFSLFIWLIFIIIILKGVKKRDK